MNKTRPIGKHRTKRPDGIEDDAWVEDDGVSMDIPESRYRERGYEPKFEDLPWLDQEGK